MQDNDSNPNDESSSQEDPDAHLGIVRSIIPKKNNKKGDIN